ncbi:uncharacterized protein LOC116621551 [Nematostella vectensis]|uniref:uncharacterized protein LOC116621551 n=1 Tax=Nematostella vectensis TaxID=45351 RepID=UPI002077198C|nr:uncharacterized protein LOC116621551 [Nematostella vectensis]
MMLHCFLEFVARSWELLLPSYKQVYSELHPRNLLKIFIKPRLLMPIVVFPVAAPRQAIVVFECPAPTVVLGDILYLVSAVTFAALICFVVNFVMKMHIQSKVKSLQGCRLASITEVHQIQEETSACPSIASTDRRESDALVTTEVNVQPSSSVKSIVTASSTGLKELRPFDLRASWDTQNLESLAACASRQGRQVTPHPLLAEFLNTLMRPLSLELEQMEPPSSATRPVLVTMHGRHAIIRHRVKVHLMDYCATEPDNMSTLLSSVSQVSHDEHEWMVAEMSEHLKANTVSVTTLQLGLEGIGMGFIDTTARPLSVSVFGCLEGEAQVETKQDQACIMAIEEMFKPSSRVKQMVTELLSGFKKPYRPHICGSLKTQSIEECRLASITEVHHFQEKTSACPSIASTDRQESDAIVTTEVNVQPSSSVKSIVTASSAGLKELRPFDLSASWDTQSLERLAACASRQGRQVTLHPLLAEFLNTLMRPLSLKFELIEPRSSAKRPVLVTMHGRHAIIRRCVKVHLMDYCATNPDNMSTLLSSVSQVSHDEHEWMVAEMSEHLKANTVSVTTLQLGLEGIGMGFIDTTARPLSVSVFGCLEGEAQVETKQDQACIMAIEEMFKPSSRVKQMVTELLSGFKKPYRPHICGSLKTQSVEGGRLASITEVHQFQEKTGACPSIASTDRRESDALVTTEVNVQPSSSVKSIVTASSIGLKELRPFDLSVSWDTQSLERLAACASRQGRQVRLHPSLAESLTRLMRPLSLEYELIEPLSSSAKRSVLVSFNGRYATIRRRVKVHLMDYCATEQDHMSAILSSLSQVSHNEHEWMAAEISEHLKANTIRVTTLQLGLEGFGMGFMDRAARPLSVSVFGCVKEEAQDEETKQDQACIMAIEDMFKPSSPVRQMVTELPFGLKEPYLPHICGSWKTQSVEECRLASITEVHHFQEKTGACSSIASTDRQENDAIVTTEVNVQPSSPVKSIVTASSTGLKELRPFDLRASWDTQSLERLAACASRQGRQVTLHPSLAEFLNTLMRPLSLELEQMEPPSSAKRPVLVTMHGRHAIIRHRVKVHLMDYCATNPDNMSTLLSSVSQVSHDEHEWMVAEMSEHLKANTVSVSTLQIDLEGIGMGFMDTTARPLSVSVFGFVKEEAQDEETKQDQACIMAIEEMFSLLRQMVVELPSGFMEPYLPGIRGSRKTHLIDDFATAPEHMAALPSSAIQLSQDEHQDCLDANKIRATSVQVHLEVLDLVLPNTSVPDPVSVSKSASLGEESQSEDIDLKQHGCCLEKPQCRITETLSEGYTDGVTTLATDFAGGLPNTPVPDPVYESKSASLGKKSQDEDTVLKQHESCEEEPQCLKSETLPKGSTDGVTTMTTDPDPVAESETAHLEEEGEPHEYCSVDGGKQLASTFIYVEQTQIIHRDATRMYLKKDEDSSSVEEPQLEIRGGDDRVSKNDNDANLATDAGVVHTPNEGVDRELPSDRTTPMSTNDGDTSKENQQLLHKCAQAQKKKAKRKNQRPKTSKRRSRKDKNDCPQEENDQELSVIGKESILYKLKTEAIVEQDVVPPKHYPVTESSDVRRDEIGHQAEEMTPHKTASELAASITDAQEGKLKGSNKLNVQTKQNKSRKTANKMDVEAEQLSVQGAKINLRESKKQKSKESVSVKKPVTPKGQEDASKKEPRVESRDDAHVTKHHSQSKIEAEKRSTKKGKHLNNHGVDYPRKGHACGVMGRPSTPSTTKRSSYDTATQKGNSIGRENHRESYQTNGMVQDGARSNSSYDSRDSKSSSRLLVKANMHQGDGRLIIPGVQCCSIALCAILRATSKSPLLWTPADMDDIIFTGDRKHRETQEKMNRPKTAFLHIDEIELDIKLRGRHFHLKRSDVMCGDIMNDGTDKNNPLPGFESSVDSLNEYDMFIVRYLLYTIALFKTSQTWLLFDSHNRDQNGFRHPDGKAVLLEFKTLRSVGCYIRRFVSFNGFSDETSPRPLDDSQLSYELAGVKVAVLS